MSAKYFYTSLAEQLKSRATRAVLGLQGFRNDALREYLREHLEQPAGTPGSFLADPVFEATFGWRACAKTWAELAGDPLHPDVIRALSNPPPAFRAEYEFPADRRPYQHQLEAWQALLDPESTRSVLVTSGTGSGKTECFLVPILSDLAREREQSRQHVLTGVRALFLYPLNALIKSQRDRLLAWSEPFKGDIRFCLYNGNTPDQIPARPQEYASEVVDRQTLRANPPPILVTNATMLEYMLVRQIDQPILSQSQGTLRWIVIDEAHTYIHGLWACVNPGCSARQQTRLDDPAWPFGRVYLERHHQCPACEYPVFELIQCNDCGAEYLTAVEVYRQSQFRPVRVGAPFLLDTAIPALLNYVKPFEPDCMI